MDQTNIEATMEAGEPVHDGNGGGASVWYSWTAPEAGDATVDTCDSDFDTVLAVYTGTNVTSLSAVTSNDDDDICGGPGSFASFSVVAGQIYRIAVDGFDGGGHRRLRRVRRAHARRSAASSAHNARTVATTMATARWIWRIQAAQAVPTTTKPTRHPSAYRCDTLAPVRRLSGKKTQKAGRSVKGRGFLPDRGLYRQGDRQHRRPRRQGRSPNQARCRLGSDCQGREGDAEAEGLA